MNQSLRIISAMALLASAGLAPAAEPDGDLARFTLGAAYAEFACGGDGAHSTPDVNPPEAAHTWWGANALGAGGTPYTDGTEIFRAGNSGQELTYEFDLPDDVTNATLRMTLHQNTAIYVAGPDGVDPGNHQSFNGTLVYEGANLDHKSIAVELAGFLTAANPQKKIYVRAQSPTFGGDWLVFRCRVDNGQASFSPGAPHLQLNDRAFIEAKAGTVAFYGNMEDPKRTRFRDIDNDSSIVWNLDLPNAQTEGYVSVMSSGQIKLSLAKDPAGPFTEFARTTTADRSRNFQARIASLAPYLAGNAEKRVYLKAETINGAGEQGFVYYVRTTVSDPRADLTNRTAGTVYAEFEAGGDNANPYWNVTPGNNQPEELYLWDGTASQTAGGLAYTDDLVYRAVVKAYNHNLTYEFDLPDDADAATVRLLIKHWNKISLGGPEAVSDADHSAFNGTVVYNPGTEDTDVKLVTFDAGAYLTASNPQKKLYVNITPGSGGDAVVLHVRVDNGWPSFTPATSNARFGDEQFVVGGNGSDAGAEGNLTYRETNGEKAVVYALDLPDAAAEAHIDLDIQGQYKLSASASATGPFTELASSDTAAARGIVQLNVTPFLAGNAGKTVYVRIEDSVPADEIGGAKWYKLLALPGLVPVELSAFSVE